MASCPYTWVRNLFAGSSATAPGAPAQHLHVRVVRDGQERVLVALPAKSARWLLEVIPGDVQRRIREEEIPLDEISAELHAQEVHYPRAIFSLLEENRKVEVWLE